MQPFVFPPEAIQQARQMYDELNRYVKPDTEAWIGIGDDYTVQIKRDKDGTPHATLYRISGRLMLTTGSFYRIV